MKKIMTKIRSREEGIKKRREYRKIMTELRSRWEGREKRQKKL